MGADALTKEMELHKGMYKLLAEDNFNLANDSVNKVQCIDGEIRMTNLQNWDRRDQQKNSAMVC